MEDKYQDAFVRLKCLEILVSTDTQPYISTETFKDAELIYAWIMRIEDETHD